MNKFKTFVLMLALTLLFVWLGDMIAGRQGAVLAFLFAAAMNFFSYWFSDKLVLAMYRAKRVEPGVMPELDGIVSGLASRAGMPVPKLYVMDTPMPNAFATGRNKDHAAVAVTTGILNLLGRQELEGVIAHELSHINNRDILISSIAATIAGAIFFLSDMMRFAAFFGGMGGRDNDSRGNALGLLVGAIVAPLAAMVIQLAISRSREYMADESGAKLSGNPLGLANALRKLESASRARPSEVRPATAHMFIVNPLSGKSMLALFSTHPPIEERVKRLEAMAGRQTGAKIPRLVY